MVQYCLADDFCGLCAVAFHEAAVDSAEISHILRLVSGLQTVLAPRQCGEFRDR